MQVSQKNLVSTLQELIRIPSVTGNEGTISKFVQNKLEALGLQTTHDEVGNVYCEIGEGKKSLMLNAHLDTVPPQGYKKDPYRGEKKGNKVIGIGASDCKAGLATMMEAARLLDPKKISGKLVLACTVAEEAVLEGKRLPKGSMYAAERYTTDGCLVLEPTMHDGVPKISAGCRGRMILELEVKGKSTHSSRPHTGENAINKTVDTVQHLMKHDLLSGYYFGKELPETLSIVRISSDSPATNIIPSRCNVTVDYRTLPGRTDVKNKIKKAIKTSAKDTGISIPYFSPGYFLDEDSGFVKVFKDSVDDAFSEDVEIMIALGRADAEYFYRNGSPAIIFGPGENHQCHKPEEYALIPGMVKSSKAIFNFIEKFLS
jgi:acetylornithine deacetylase/succinyl-diaminopimelate desuccinylase-like protein